MNRKPTGRGGAAAAELAVLLPLLFFIFLAVVDFARIFYPAMTIQNAARNGALWLSDPVYRQQSGYATLLAAVQADTSNLNPPLTSSNVASTSGTDNGRTFHEVTITYEFTTVSNYPWIPKTTTLTRSCRMYEAPVMPN
jgi:Flp pilus assembly protein TadG